MLTLTVDQKVETQKLAETIVIVSNYNISIKLGIKVLIQVQMQVFLLLPAYIINKEKQKVKNNFLYYHF